MKINRIIGIVAVLIAAVSCQVVPEEDFSGLNRTGEKGVFCYFPTLVYDEPDTKAVTAADDNIHVTFDDGDRIGIWSDEGTLLTYKLKVIHENEASASFSGGGFTLENGEDYTSIYPRLMTDEFEAIPLSFEGQVQKDNADPGHLKNYLYMWAQATCIDYATAFHYNYLPGFIRFRLTFAEAATVKTVKLVADTKVFDPEPTLNAATGVLTKGTLSKEISVDLKNGFHVEADGTIVVYMAAAPFASATVTVQAVTTDDKVFFSTETRTISALESGHIKKLTRTMQFIDTEHNIEIDSSTETEKDLEVEGDLHVTIVKSDSNTVNSMTINATNEAKHPDNVYITIAEECTLEDMDLTINMPYSHVVLSAEADEEIGSITTNTSLNTLVLTDMITVKAVTIAANGGGLTVDGTITGTLTVPNNAAVDQTEPEKIWVKINESAEVGTISVVETNCNLYIAGTVGTVTTSAAQTTVEGTVTQNLTADGTAEVMVTSSAVVEDATLVAKSESIIYLDADAQIPESDSSYYGDQETGEYTGTIRPNAKPVASVDGVDYMSLESAIAAVPTTGIKTTVTLLKDLTAEDITDNVVFGGSFAANSTTLTSVTSKNVTLNLNGHNITSAKTLYLAGGTLEITGTGTIETTGSGVAAVGVRYVKTANYADLDYTSKRTLTIGKDVTLRGPYGLNIFGTNEATVANSIEVNVDGKIYGDLFILGNLTNASNAINVNVNGTIEVAAEKKVGIALNGNANVVIGENASITGPTGIEVRAGNLTVNGGTVAATADEFSIDANGSGTTSKGAAICVSQHGTNLPIHVTVNGGTFTGVKALHEEDVQTEPASGIALSVNDGTFNGKIYSENCAGFITGGTFNSDPTEYVAAGYEATQSGDVWTVAPVQGVAKIGSTRYESLAEAFAAVQDGETITLLKDQTQDAGVLFNKENVSAKFDLNKHTLTVNNGSNINNRAIRIDNGTLEVYNGSFVAVGAGTTSSNGTGCYGAFRVEANGKLVAHDLTLTNSRPWGLNVKVLGGEAELTDVTINSSYGGGIEVTEADLGTQSKTGSATLTNCTFTQTGYFDHCSTTLSVSGGSELIVNSGSYTSDNYALYVFSSGGVITVNGGEFSGNHNGVAIVAQIDTNTYPQYEGGLKISGGTVNGGFSITFPASMSITGGTYDHDPSAYVAEGYEAVYANNLWTVQEAADVAQIGEDKYPTLAAAVAAATSGQTIKILKNFTIEGNAGVEIPAGKTITLDLNGKTIKNLVTEDKASQLISNKGTLTITDSSAGANGTMTNEIADGVHTGAWTGYNYSTSIISNAGTLIIENGNINQVATTNISYAIDNLGANTSTTVNGGNLVAGYIPIRSFNGQNKSVAIHGGALTGLFALYLQSTTTLTIDGGTFNAPTRNAIYVDAASTINISGDCVFNYVANRQFVAFDNDNVQNGSTVSVTGGTFSSDPAAFVAAGYEATHSGNVWTVDEMQGVAQIGQTTYASLAEAFAAVPASGATTITMLRNTDIVFEGATFVTVAAGQDITLDLNGYEINIAPEAGWNTTSQAILNNGKLTFVDNSANHDGFIAFDAYPTWVYQDNYNYSNSYASNLIANKNSGEVYVESGTLKNVGGGSACYVIDAYNSAKTYINGGSIIATKTALRQFTGTAANLLQINGGVINAGRFGVSIHTNTGSSSKFEMTGGTVNGEYGVVVYCNNNAPASPELTISGGNMNAVVYVDGHFPASGITVSGGQIDSFFSEDADCRPITGGTFAHDPSQATDPDNGIQGIHNHVAPGYEAVNNGNSTWTVQQMTGVAQIGSTRYASLAAAIAAVHTDGTKTTITMIANETMAENTVIEIAATKNIVLDLNGKTISSIGGSTTASYYFIQNRGTLEINDFSSAKNGKITSACTIPSPGYSKEYVTVYNIGGTLTLAAGTVETTSGGLSYAINNSSNAWGVNDNKETVFTMTGGTINAPSGDAALRVYQNCADTTTPFSHNTVTISGGTIASGGIFLDNYIYKPNVNTTGAGINTNVTITGGEIHGLIDMKLRHAFHTTFTISGGTFVDSKLWVRKHSEWNSVVAEPTEPIFTINGNCNFTFKDHMAFGLAYDCGASSWTSYTRPYSILAGSFNEDPSAFVPTEGYAVTLEDGVYTVGITTAEGNSNEPAQGDDPFGDDN